jgi:hypothetical protein
MSQAIEPLIHGYTTIYVPETHIWEESRVGSGVGFVSDSLVGMTEGLLELFPSSMEWFSLLFSLIFGLTAVNLCPKGGTCGNWDIVVMWIYLSWGWKLSGYRYLYLLSVATAVWPPREDFNSISIGPGYMLAALASAALLEAVRVTT